MSYVMLVAADHPLPLYDSGIRRSSASTAGGAYVQVETPGFSIQPHQYYRDAVEALGLEMKLWQYELNVEAAEAEAEQLRAYLKRSCRPGETIELWNLWVGDDREEKIARFQGRLGDLDQEALAALAEETPLGAIGTPEDVAEAIWYLSSDAARFVTGQVLAPNGGLGI